MTDDAPFLPGLSPVGGKPVQITFDAGRLTSDGGILLLAEIERTEHGDSGRARAWTLRAVRARHDPVWTADGYVSDRWRPVSPVSGSDYRRTRWR